MRRVLLRHLAHHAVGSALLAVLLAITVFIVAVAPRLAAQLAEDELQAELASLSPLRSTVTAGARFGYPQEQGDTIARMDGALHDVPSQLEPPIADVLGAPAWVARFEPGNAPRRANGVLPVLRLAVDPDWSSRVELVDGAAPAPWTGDAADDTPADQRPPIDIALSQDAAQTLGATVGELIEFEPAPLRVAAIYVAADPSSDYWAQSPDLLLASSINGAVAAASVYLDPDSTAGMLELLAAAELRVWYPSDLQSISLQRTPALLEQLRELLVTGTVLPSGERLLYQSGLTGAIDRADSRIAIALALLALAVSAPLGALGAVVALAAGAALRARERALALAGARGASPAQLRATLAAEGLLLAVPATASGIWVAAALVPAAVGVGAALAPLAVGAALPALLAARRLPAGNVTEREGVDRSGRWRLIAELLTVGLAAAAVLALARRGLFDPDAQAGVDPLLAATPLLVAAAACLLVLRVYPLPLRVAQRIARGRRGVVGVLGAARAARNPTAGFLAVLAVTAGMAASVFSLAMSASIDAALDGAARAQVGAELSVSSAGAAELVDGLRARPDVTAVAGLQLVRGVELGGGTTAFEVTVVIADTALLSVIAPELPALSTGELAVSSDLQQRVGAHIDIAGISADALGAVPQESLPGLERAWVLIDAAWAEPLLGVRFEPTTLLVDLADGADAARVADALDGEDATVLTATGVRETLAARPAIAGTSAALLVATAGSWMLAAAAMALVAFGAGRARNRADGILRMLGASRAQTRALALVELLPSAATAVLAGTAVGAGLAWTVGALVDLREFLGGSAPIPVVVPWPLVAAVGVGFCALVVAVGAIAAAIARRADPASTLRIGD